MRHPESDHPHDNHHESGQTDILRNFHAELSDGRQWLERAIVLAHAVVAGLAVVGFTLLSDKAFEAFGWLYAFQPWLVLLWMPLLTGGIVWLTRRHVSGAAGSGIPQVMAALDVPSQGLRSRFVSLRLSIGKIFLGAAGLLAGLSLGREGPSVQVAAGVMQNARRWLRSDSGITVHALLVAGGASGIAAAFNAPLAGVVFAFEELSRGKAFESRNSGVVLVVIVLAGLMSVSVFGNVTYFGVIHVPHQGWAMLLPGLLTALVCGLLGGLFARLLIASLTNVPDRFNRLRARYPMRFAAALGLALAVIGLVSHGATFGAGSEAVRQMLADDAQTHIPPLYVLLKFAATWLTTWSGVPGGIFAPSLSIGAGVGHDVAALFNVAALAAPLIAIGMTAFLAAVTQAPLTAFIIVMEMVDGHAMVLSLMAAAMLAALISRLISRPLYGTLARYMVGQATK